MAAASMDAFGTYKTQYYRYLQQCEEREKAARAPSTQVVWVTKRYDPLDLRDCAPVPRHKLVASKVPPPVQQHWVPVPLADLPMRSFEREQPGLGLASYPSTRDEHWSTLKQILPSIGSAHKVRPPSWGTGQATPPFMSARQARRMPKVNSPMTRYRDEVHAITHLEKLQ